MPSRRNDRSVQDSELGQLCNTNDLRSQAYVNAKCEVEGEPDDDDRGEETANLRSSQRLNQKEQD